MVISDIYNSLLCMEHNSLTGIACARPIIYAEGLFASCYLENGQFIPEEGLSKADLWSILNGDFLKSGSDLVEDFTVSIVSLTSVHGYKCKIKPKTCSKLALE